MNLLVDAADLARRRLVAQNQLEPLLASLGHDMGWMLDRELYVPKEKALLSRAGGRCPRDGTLLEFDPQSPHAHRCGKCGEVFAGELHDRFWIYWYQLWLAERAVHGALIGRLADAPRFTSLAVQILERYAAGYLDYPNDDNVLGPTRLFFSTYLESVWLLQMCVATSLLEADRPTDLGRRVRDRIIDPARQIIGEFDEGLSNRQVWNNAALFAAARLLDDRSALDRLVHGPSGLLAHLERGILADGTWYEGENYHLFAHRGLWYGVVMAARADVEIPASLHRRFRDGFATPFATALPDFTLPSRRDSPYGVSLRQWRIAEHVELGLSLGDDDRLTGALFHMYRDDVPRRDTGRSRSSADIERNGPGTALSRADLSWRALLHARPELPALEPYEPTSILLEQQGIAVFRGDRGRQYVALDFGASGGGHGHPDRLNLLLVDGATRWLDDLGTGSYVDPSLHWYRSTLAHNAPLADGRSQRRADGVLRAFDVKSDASWIAASAEIAPGVTVQRTLIVLDGYVVDELKWKADREVTLDLPLHAPLEVIAPNGRMAEAPMPGGDAAEDGFRFLQSTLCSRIPARADLRMQSGSGDDHRLSTWSSSDAAIELWHAEAPGAPVGFGAGEPQTFVIVRMRDKRGSFRTVWSLNGALTDVRFADATMVALSNGEQHTHRAAAAGWEIAIRGDASRRVVLGGLQPERERPPTPEQTRTRAPVRLPRGATTEFTLGEASYVRSESDWNKAGRPIATVALTPGESDLTIEIRVPASERTFVPANADNPLDNEAADINGDGVQLYMEVEGRRGAWVLVPETDSDGVRVRRVEGDSALAEPTARWSRVGDGYAMTVMVPNVPQDEFRFDVIINEKPAHRRRRRGQLVLSGGQGAFVYLRGDRQDWDRLLTFRVDD